MMKSIPVRPCTFVSNGPRLSSHRLCRTTASALGFRPPEENSSRALEAAADLVDRASSLFLYNHVLESPPGSAFVKLLTTLGGGSDKAVLDAFSKFARALAEEKASSWSEYLATQVVLAPRDHLLARALSRGDVDFADLASPSHPLTKAASFDLDLLQQFALSDATILRFVRDSLRHEPAGWPEAATAMLSVGSTVVSAAGKSVQEASLDDLASSPCLSSSHPIGPPISVATRRALVDKMLSSWKWSDCLGLVGSSYAIHSCGMLGQTMVLKWAGDGLVTAERDATWPHETLPALPDEWNEWAVKFGTVMHPAPPPPAMPSSLLPSPMQLAQALVAAQPSLRVVILPTAHVATFPALLRSLAAHSRTRFVLLVGPAVHVGLEHFPTHHVAILTVDM